jgi:serine/threonine protein kinase
MESPDVLVPGAKAGPWVVERELGRGGMGAVYAVVHEDIGKRAALKVVHKRLLTPAFNSDRMLLEAKVVNQVGHPNIVDIFETGKLADGRPYIVMERLDGQSLSQRADGGKLLPDLVIKILLQVCDALIAAHAAGVVHRDLKTDNVFLVDNAESPETPKVKLLDWGIAKLIHHDVKHTVEGQLVGTPQYLSPEQARGLTVTPQTDVYSLGVMAYELFLEQLPFEAETAAEVMAMHLRATPPPPNELWPDVPPRLQDLLLAMLAKQPDQRPTAHEVARKLEMIREELDRRRNGRTEPRHRTATPIDTSSSRRVSSAPGLAATEVAAWSTGDAHHTRAKRWQYTVGICALAASGLLFWISRIGDHPANAATAPAITERADRASIATSPAPTVVATESVPSANMSAAARAELLSVAGPHATGNGATRAELVSVTATRPVTRSLESRVSPAAKARPTASRSAPAVRPAPAAPRRGAKVDPDGTFEPYL